MVYIATICALVCGGMHRKVPINFALLAVFTLCVSFIVGTECAKYAPSSVLEAAVLTAGVTIAITLWAATTKTDLTICGPVVFVLGFVFVIGGIFACVFGPTGHLLFSMIGVILFSFYLAYDTQIIVGGQHK